MVCETKFHYVELHPALGWPLGYHLLSAAQSALQHDKQRAGLRFPTLFNPAGPERKAISNRHHDANQLPLSKQAEKERRRETPTSGRVDLPDVACTRAIILPHAISRPTRAAVWQKTWTSSLLLCRGFRCERCLHLSAQQHSMHVKNSDAAPGSLLNVESTFLRPVKHLRR